MNKNISEIIAWISTGIAVSVGIYITGNPFCLVALLIPAITYSK